MIFRLQVRLQLCGRVGREGGWWAGAGGEHPGFGRQQTKMDECGKAKVRGEEDNKGTMKEQECVGRAVLFL